MTSKKYKTLLNKFFQDPIVQERFVAIASELDPDVQTVDVGRSKGLTPEETEQFELLWSSYGRRGVKQKALISWKRLSHDNRSKAQQGVKAFIADRPEKFRPFLHKWINEKQWEMTTPTESTLNDSKPVDRLGNNIKQLW